MKSIRESRWGSFGRAKPDAIRRSFLCRALVFAGAPVSKPALCANRHSVFLLPLALAVVLCAATAGAADPLVSNVRAAQRAGTQLVDITYDVADADSSSLIVSAAISTNGGTSYFTPGSSLSGALGAGIAPGSNKKITWNAGVDLPAKLFSNVRVSVTAWDDTAPSGMALIPAGSFAMGATTNIGHESYSGEVPQHTVYVSAFYMDRTEVTKVQWHEVYTWATNHGYSFDNSNSGHGKTNNHPAYWMSWYDAVKWCNARSEKEGRTPAYYTDAGLTVRYRAGQVAQYVNWSSGYRLPTDAEWEKAARGGASGHRFPWSDTDNITHSRANYYSYGVYAYDTSPTRGFHPTFNDGVTPLTSPAGYFAANGYGLYDMAGNVWEWCWDWYSSVYYSSSPGSDPRGPTSGSPRVVRGGGWGDRAYSCRTASRSYYNPTNGYSIIGFRSVLPPGQ